MVLVYTQSIVICSRCFCGGYDSQMIKNRSVWSDIVVVCVSGSALLLTSLSYAAPTYLDMNERSLGIIEKKYGPPARRRVAKWTKSLNHLSQRRIPDHRLMQFANDYFNSVKWRWDIDHWGQEDYWATPVETLATNAGDCEDFSIGKYFSLINTGVDAGKLRITYVKALDYDLAHMVLAYYPKPNAEPFILDNINKTCLLYTSPSPRDRG